MIWKKANKRGSNSFFLYFQLINLFLRIFRFVCVVTVCSIFRCWKKKNIVSRNWIFGAGLHEDWFGEYKCNAEIFRKVSHSKQKRLHVTILIDWFFLQSNKKLLLNRSKSTKFSYFPSSYLRCAKSDREKSWNCRLTQSTFCQ